jgi:hypothetical protein
MSDESSKQNTGQAVEPQLVKVEFVVPDPDSPLFTTYANNVQVAATIHDIRMIFGETVDLLPTKIVVEQRAQITISYLQAKMLMSILGQAVANHESKFGEIKLTPEIFNVGSVATIGTVPPGATSRKP